MPTHLPHANTINYRNADEICGYQVLLCKMYEQAGGFGFPPATNKDTLAIRREGLIWLKEVSAAIDSLFASPVRATAVATGISLRDVPAILAAYDFFYRVCHGAPYFDYLRKVRLQAVNRYLKGDKTISQAQIALMLRHEINRDIRSIEQRYLDFSGSVMEAWVDDLERYGRLRNMSLGEAYDVLRYLLREDLFAFISNADSKLRWIKAYTLPEEQIDALDTPTLRAYIAFEQAVEALTGLPPTEQTACHLRRAAMLSRRSDLNPFFRECIALDLAGHRTA